MKSIDTAKQAVDTFQQNHRYVAFPVAVIKRYGDDQAGRQAALITYYAFLAIFPLLLVFITFLRIAISGDPVLQQRISSQVFQYFPALGSSLVGSVHTLKGSGVVLVLELLILLYGARGLAAMLQEAFNHVWHIDKKHRPGFVGDNLRSFGMMFSVGIGIVIGAAISYGLGSILHIGFIGTALLTLLNLLFTFGLFLVVFRLGTSSRVHLHSLILGAVIASIGVLIVQHFGTFIMGRELPKLKDSYGSFYLALGIIFWIYLQAQVILYAMEITAVRTQKDWPKKLF